MELADCFTNDDGSLPEIEVSFESGDAVLSGLAFLFAQGARNAATGGTSLCISPLKWMQRMLQGYVR